MTADELDLLLRAVSHRRPFRPYEIVFVSGDRLMVKHPELVVRRGIVYLYQTNSKDWRLFAAASVSHLQPALEIPAL